jgi:Na+/melibiose symporter-like transporter
MMTEDQRDRAKLLSFARIAGGIGAGITIVTIQPVALALGRGFADAAGGAAQGERLGFIAAAAITALSARSRSNSRGCSPVNASPHPKKSTV